MAIFFVQLMHNNYYYLFIIHVQPHATFVFNQFRTVRMTLCNKALSWVTIFLSVRRCTITEKRLPYVIPERTQHDFPRFGPMAVRWKRLWARLRLTRHMPKSGMVSRWSLRWPAEPTACLAARRYGVWNGNVTVSGKRDFRGFWGWSYGAQLTWWLSLGSRMAVKLKDYYRDFDSFMVVVRAIVTKVYFMSLFPVSVHYQEQAKCVLFVESSPSN